MQSHSLPSYWDIWRRALRCCFLNRSSRLLHSPLGRWHQFPACWIWHYPPAEDRLYKQECWMWRASPIYRIRTSARYGIAKFRRSEEVTRTWPKDLITASVDQTKAWVLKVATMVILDHPIVTNPITNNVRALLSPHHDSFQWAVSEMSLSDNGIAITQALIQGTAIAVSDGSFKESQGTSAFIIKGESKQGRLVGVNVIPGDESSQSPYRGKLGGVADILECLHCICVAHGITDGKVEVGLDDEQAMKEAFGDWPLNPGRPDFDMLQHILGMIAASPLSFSSRWIASHPIRTTTWSLMLSIIGGSSMSSATVLPKAIGIRTRWPRPGGPISSSTSKNGPCGLTRRSSPKSTRKSYILLLSRNAPRPTCIVSIVSPQL